MLQLHLYKPMISIFLNQKRKVRVPLFWKDKSFIDSAVRKCWLSEIHWVFSCLSSVTEFPSGNSDYTITGVSWLRCIPAHHWPLWPRTGFLWCFTWGTQTLLLLLKGHSKQWDSPTWGTLRTLEYSSCMSWICVLVLKQVQICQSCWS